MEKYTGIIVHKIVGFGITRKTFNLVIFWLIVLLLLVTINYIHVVLETKFNKEKYTMKKNKN